jgi:hypothetical protein
MVVGMTTQEQISKSQTEGDEARQDLRDTLNEANRKVERAGDELRPTHLVASHPISATIIAGVFGYLIGSSNQGRAIGPIVIAAVAGFALSLRSSRETVESDVRETSPID